MTTGTKPTTDNGLPGAEPGPALSAPDASTEEPDGPPYSCDLILKGGITSGIVYPPAIVEIARDHRLCSVGGSSAGAIAAVAAAAAELGRYSRTGGFPVLEQLPARLSETDSAGRTRLQRLFQPDRQTAGLFNLFWLSRERGPRGLFRELVLGNIAKIRVPRSYALAGGGLLAVAVAATIVGLLLAGPWSLIASVPFVVLAVAVAWAVISGGRIYRLGRQAPGLVADNLFGLCSGSTTGNGEIGLTDWLYEVTQELAGRNDPGLPADLQQRPVTYGDLEPKGIDLVTVTTNISQGTSETFPLAGDGWAFSADDMRRLFPEPVVAQLINAAPTADRSTPQGAALARLGLTMLPDAADLPIIFGARVSLSFPLLLSAVPLYRWVPTRTADGWRMSYVKLWFSDGGITSNLPVHLFDRPLPGRPTYAINLSGGSDPDRPAYENVSRPVKSQQGQRLPATPIDSTPGFLGAVFETMQNWTDNALAHAPGYRDRICTVRLADDEGGMNLAMSPTTIKKLLERGAAAGRNLAWIRRGTISDPYPIAARDVAKYAHQWDRHRFTRLRTVLSGLGTYLVDSRAAWQADVAPAACYADIADGAASEDWYPYRAGWTQPLAGQAEQLLSGNLFTNLEPFTATPRGVGLGYRQLRPKPMQSPSAAGAKASGQSSAPTVPLDSSAPTALPTAAEPNG